MYVICVCYENKFIHSFGESGIPLEDISLIGTFVSHERDETAKKVKKWLDVLSAHHFVAFNLARGA